MQGRVAHLPFFLLFHHLLLSPSTNNSRRSRLRVHQTEEVGKFIPGKAARVECTPSRAALCCCFCCCCFYLSLLFPSALRPSFPAIDSIPARCYDRREVRSPAQVKAHGNDTAASSKQPPFILVFFLFFSSPFLLLFSRLFGFLFFFFMLSMRLSAIDEVTGLVADTTTHFPFLCGTSVPCAAPPPNSVNGSTHVCVCVCSGKMKSDKKQGRRWCKVRLVCLFARRFLNPTRSGNVFALLRLRMTHARRHDCTIRIDCYATVVHFLHSFHVDIGLAFSRPNQMSRHVFPFFRTV